MPVNVKIKFDLPIKSNIHHKNDWVFSYVGPVLPARSIVNERRR
jgi:hypothetical protein